MVATSDDVINEFDLIDQLTAGIPFQSEGLLCGLGDDCAVLTGGGTRDWLISLDNYRENVHFKMDWAAPEQIGCKAAVGALSDIVAMGGRPRFLLVGLGIPETMRRNAVQACFRAIRETAQSVSTLVIGGDTTHADNGFHLALTAIGEVPHGRAIYRRGARPGDALYVTGTLGGSAAGLISLQRGLTGSPCQPFIARHLAPPLRVRVADWLASTGCVTSMIDISDGLLADAEHLAQASRAAVRVEAMRVPMADGLTAWHEISGEHPLHTAVSSGEEYELLFTVAGPRAAAFQQLAAAAERTLGHAVTLVGSVVAGEGVALVDGAGDPIAVPSRGFAHRFSA